jgi:predicted Na+-dependent transporter
MNDVVDAILRVILTVVIPLVLGWLAARSLLRRR